MTGLCLPQSMSYSKKYISQDFVRSIAKGFYYISMKIVDTA